MKKLKEILFGILFLTPFFAQAKEFSQVNNTSPPSHPLLYDPENDNPHTWALVEIINEALSVGILPQPKKQPPTSSAIEIIDIPPQNENLLTLDELMQTEQPKKIIPKIEAKNSPVFRPTGTLQDNIYRELKSLQETIIQTRSQLRLSDLKLKNLKRSKNIDIKCMEKEEYNNNKIKNKLSELIEDLKQLGIKMFQLGI